MFLMDGQKTLTCWAKTNNNNKNDFKLSFQIYLFLLNTNVIDLLKYYHLLEQHRFIFELSPIKVKMQIFIL